MTEDRRNPRNLSQVGAAGLLRSGFGKLAKEIQAAKKKKNISVPVDFYSNPRGMRGF